MKTVNQNMKERGVNLMKIFNFFFGQNLVKFSLQNKESKIKYAPFLFLFFAICAKICTKKGANL
jgi:hypothetical protein